MYVRGRNLEEGIRECRCRLRDHGSIVETPNWQGSSSGFRFLELTYLTLSAPLEETLSDAAYYCHPLLPWADDHMLERTGGLPLNPPPSHNHWRKGTSDYLSDDEKFSHSYPERMWPKSILKSGIRFETGDLGSLVDLLRKDRYTRQAYLPIWFPEDLSASLLNERVPCTLGWHFMIRSHEGVDRISVMYPMRSTDAVRHFHNDVYMSNALALWIRDSLSDTGIPLEMGELTMTMSSFHCFENDRYSLDLAIRNELN